MDLAALAAKHRARSAAAGPADVRNIRPSLREFERYVTTQRAELAVVGELRRRDPDRGSGAGTTDARAFAKSLADAGCYGVCVCVDEVFGGSLDDLRAVDSISPVPVLARGVVLDVQDLYRQRDAGADAFVLYAALHDAASINALRKAARSMRAEILVEVTDDASLATALASEATLIAVSGVDAAGNPDLAAASRRLKQVPATRVPILAGGVGSPDELQPLLPDIDAVVLVEPLGLAAPGAVAEPFTTLV